jgi:putative iron-dependent peroxidase
MKTAQAGILQAIPSEGRYLFFSLVQPAGLRAALARLAALADGQTVVVGLGLQTIEAIGAKVPGLRDMPAFSGVGVALSSTPIALWCWLRGKDRGDLVRLSRQLEKAMLPVFHLNRAIDAFRHGTGRDLTGYEDGTENPKGGAAPAAALLQGQGAGLDGSSFVAVQQWLHDFPAFEALGTQAQDNAVGRRRSDNGELDDAPESAHVKRTAQESFTPEAFVLRRSMPWAMSNKAGLMFVAFGHSFDAFEAQMRRMAGLEDGILDALFQFSKPVNGAYLWCPPVQVLAQGSQLDLRQIGI